MKPLEEKQEVSHCGLSTAYYLVLPILGQTQGQYFLTCWLFSPLSYRRRGQRWTTWEGHPCLWAPWRKSLTTTTQLFPPQLDQSITSASCHLWIRICWSRAAPSCSTTRSINHNAYFRIISIFLWFQILSRKYLVAFWHLMFFILLPAVLKLKIHQTNQQGFHNSHTLNRLFTHFHPPF